MPHVISLKDGRTETILEPRDALDLVAEYAGYELKSYLEDYLREQIEELEEERADLRYSERESESEADHNRAVLCSIRDEAAALSRFIEEKRMNRNKMRTVVKSIYRQADAEL